MTACHGDGSEALTIIQYLLDRGAKVCVKDGDGQTGIRKPLICDMTKQLLKTAL